MNTGVPTGFDFTDRKELLKVIASHITNSCLEGAQLISFKKFAFYKFYLNLINLTPLYISSIWFNWFDWKLKLKIKSTPASPIHCVENQRPPFWHISPCPPPFLKIPQKQVCWTWVWYPLCPICFQYMSTSFSNNSSKASKIIFQENISFKCPVHNKYVSWIVPKFPHIFYSSFI